MSIPNSLTYDKPTTYPMENKLDPEFKAKWIAALRSGEYEQCYNAMTRDGKYCCLGVARAVQLGKKFGSNEIDYRLPFPLSSKHGEWTSEQKVFIHLNDVEKKSFSEIADYIEASL